MSCGECERYRTLLGEIHDAIGACLDKGRIGKQADYVTEHGKLIAATATAKGLKLAEVSKAAGYGKYYAARICRGDMKLTVRSAKLIGQALGIDLLVYVGREFTLGDGAGQAAGETPETTPAEPVVDKAPELPLGGDQAVA
jgi:transcriptional regulator with XRE-family HTH domain